MPFYAHIQNKRLLWKTIQSTDLFQKSSVDWSWFQRIIESFSEKYYTDLTPNELLQANQETILYMVEEMENQMGIRKPRGLRPDANRIDDRKDVPTQSGLTGNLPTPTSLRGIPPETVFLQETNHMNLDPLDPIYINDRINISEPMKPLRESYDRLKPETPNFVIPQDYTSQESIDVLLKKMQKERDFDQFDTGATFASETSPSTILSKPKRILRFGEESDVQNPKHTMSPGIRPSDMQSSGAKQLNQENDSTRMHHGLSTVDMEIRLRMIEEKLDKLLCLLTPKRFSSSDIFDSGAPLLRENSACIRIPSSRIPSNLVQTPDVASDVSGHFLPQNVVVENMSDTSSFSFGA